MPFQHTWSFPYLDPDKVKADADQYIPMFVGFLASVPEPAKTMLILLFQGLQAALDNDVARNAIIEAINHFTGAQPPSVAS